MDPKKWLPSLREAGYWRCLWGVVWRCGAMTFAAIGTLVALGAWIEDLSSKDAPGIGAFEAMRLHFQRASLEKWTIIALVVFGVCAALWAAHVVHTASGPAAWVRKLRAVPARYLLDHKASMADLSEYLGPFLVDEWRTARELADAMVPHNPDGTVYGKVWLAAHHGNALNAAEHFCREMEARKYLLRRTESHTVVGEAAYPSPCHFFRWSPPGLRLYEQIVNLKHEAHQTTP